MKDSARPIGTTVRLTTVLRLGCNQHRVKGIQINYKSTGKYIGGDAVEALVLFPGGFAWEVQYKISVR